MEWSHDKMFCENIIIIIKRSWGFEDIASITLDVWSLKVVTKKYTLNNDIKITILIYYSFTKTLNEIFFPIS